MSSGNKYWSYTLTVSLTLPVYAYFAYFLDRTDFLILLAAFSSVFTLYAIQIIKIELPSLKWLIISAMALRLIFLFSEPTLSDDIYRFIWDGRLWQAGINPFSHLPDYFINSDIHIAGIDSNLYEKLNSKHYFSVYPPVNQLIFYLSTIFDVENMWISIILIRISIITAEIISFFTIIRILDRLKLPKKRLAIYALNPLVIIELSGNLHFEAWLITFLLISFLMFLKNKITLSAIFMALAIASKLWPLMFLPLFFGKMNTYRLIKYYIICFVALILTFIPLFEAQLLNNLFRSIDLYFQKFEFNASFFYIARYIGFQWKGFDLVQIIGPVSAVITFIAILELALKSKNKPASNLPFTMLMAFSIYLFLGTTIHPWYLTLPIALSLFTNYRFILLWSYLAVLSYFAYSQADWQESYLLLSIEYILVFLFLILELKYDGKFAKKLAAYLS